MRSWSVPRASWPRRSSKPVRTPRSLPPAPSSFPGDDANARSDSISRACWAHAVAHHCAPARTKPRRCVSVCALCQHGAHAATRAGTFRSVLACEHTRDFEHRTSGAAFARQASTESQPRHGASDGVPPGSARPAEERSEPALRLLEHSLPFVRTLARRFAFAACSGPLAHACAPRRAGRTTRFAQERCRLACRPHLSVCCVRPRALGRAAADACFAGLLPRGAAQLVEHFTSVCDHAFVEALDSKQDEFAGAAASIVPLRR